MRVTLHVLVVCFSERDNMFQYSAAVQNAVKYFGQSAALFVPGVCDSQRQAEVPVSTELGKESSYVR